MSVIKPFELQVPEKELDYLRNRLEMARWPEPETVEGWLQGVPISRLRSLVAYWVTKYDWRRCEAFLNRIGQFKTVIDGLEVYFLHIRSPHAGALPLLLTHG